MSSVDDLAGKRITVMGLGRFGGGVGVTRFLVDQGADVLVTDQLPEGKLTDSLNQLADLPSEAVQYRLGEHNVSDFTVCDLVVVNPAVNPATNRFCRAAQAAGVPLTSEMRLLVQRLPNRRQVIGVTGTAGKSTTTAMIAHVLREFFTSTQPMAQQLSHPAVLLGGNIGGSLLDALPQITAEDWVVLELSSFMLDGLDADGWSPGIAVVTNISPNHLDWHQTVEAYTHAKQAMLRHQQPGDAALLGPAVADWPTQANVQRRVVEPPAQYPLLTSLPGRHNQHNAAFAMAVCEQLGLDLQTAEQVLQSFAGLPHRLQRVVEHEQVCYFNDSKSTTPEAAMLAIDAFEPMLRDSAAGLHLIAGGYDKGSDLTDLARHAAQHVRCVHTIGDTGPTLAEQVRQAGGKATYDRDLAAAVQAIVGQVQRGDVVLLSPGCASWDQFDHYEQRGEAFTQAVLQYTSEAGVIPKFPDAST